LASGCHTGPRGGRYSWARYYHPTLQRFITEDPIGLFGGGTNLYAYVGNNPVQWRDPLGLYTEVIIWEGVGIGKSSLGHVSVNVNGEHFSFAPAGWDRTYPTAAEYIARQQTFRGGLGVVLDLTPGQEAELMGCLKAQNDPWRLTKNNCGGPSQRCLNQVGVGSGTERILPAMLKNDLLASPIRRQVNIYDPPAYRDPAAVLSRPVAP